MALRGGGRLTMASHDVRWWFVENQALFVEVKDLSQKGPVGGLFTPCCCCRAFLLHLFRGYIHSYPFTFGHL